MARPLVLCAALLLLAAGCAPERREPPPTLSPALWRDFAARFLDGGRVVDRDNGGISHSEGQGYGLLFAEAAGDHRGFERLWRWTRRHLQRDDGLLAWRWQPGQGVTDSNNASDGDILVAWALLRAAERWRDDDYRRQGLALVTAIRTWLLREHGGALYLLPGRQGFDKAGGLVLNPSYYVFPALAAFAIVDPTGPWQQVIDDGLAMIAAGQVAPINLPPDWLLLGDSGLTPAPGFPPRFSWDAVRIPLYLAWHSAGTPSRLAPYADYWPSRAGGSIPAWVDLATGETANYAASRGVQAIAALTMAISQGVQPPMPPPVPDESDGYFSTCLLLLVAMATNEGRGGTS